MYKLVDYWNNGNIDVMVGDVLLAEVKPVRGGFMLYYGIQVNRPDIKALEQWVQSHISTMVMLTKAAG